MSILGKIATEVAKAATEDVRYGALGKAAEASKKIADKLEDFSEKRTERKYEEYKKQLLENHPENCHLIMKEDRQYEGSWDLQACSDYYIGDMNDEIKYVAKGRREKRLQRIKLYDSESNIIGEVIEQLFALRNPLTSEMYPADYTIMMYGKKVGEIKTARTKFFDNNEKMSLDFIDWDVQRSLKGLISITDSRGNTIGEIKESFWGGVTGFDFVNPADEVLMVLLALVFDANDKSGQRKSDRESRRG